MYSGRSPQDPGKGPRLLLPLVAGVVLLGGGAVFMHHVAPHFLSGQALAIRARLNLPVAAQSNANAQVATAKTVAPAPASDQPVKFDFYNELPTMQAETAGENPKPVTVAVRNQGVHPVKHVAASGNYVLQLGFFSDRRAAAQTRLNFLLSGIDSLIVSEKTASGAAVFRIQQGPYATEHEARLAQARLKEKGVEALLRKTAEG